VQYREVQGSESPQLLSYFPRLVCLEGGVATGFRKVEEAPPPEVKRLYRITLSRASGEAGKQASTTLVIRELPPSPTSLVAGEAYILDKGDQVWQLNTTSSAGQERYKAAEFAQSLINERKGQCDLTVFGESLSDTEPVKFTQSYQTKVNPVSHGFWQSLGKALSYSQPHHPLSLDRLRRRSYSRSLMIQGS
jgi:hypothetical protein